MTFNRGALIFLFSLVAIVSGMAIFSMMPSLDHGNLEDKTVLEKPTMDVEAHVDELSSRHKGDDLQEKSFPDKEEIATFITRQVSAEETARIFDEIAYNIEGFEEASLSVPRLYLKFVPYDLHEIKDISFKKKIFLQALLPLVLRVNEMILADRERIKVLNDRLSENGFLEEADMVWLKEIAGSYGIEMEENLISDRLDALLIRVDIVPPSLALAQAIEESGWGTSRFTREANALYGQKTYSKKHAGIIPKQVKNESFFRIRAFDSLLESVRSYMRNLNTHRAYEMLRLQRKEFREQQHQPDGRALVLTLEKYSERRKAYTRSLLGIIASNNLQRFDEAKLYAPRELSAELTR